MTKPIEMLAPGEIAPAGGNVALGANPSHPFGVNNELLDDAKPHLVNALRELVRQYREEGIVVRRREIRRIRQARLFWQGLHYAWWNPNDMNWHLPFEQRTSDDRALEEMPRYQFVTNFYQGFGLSFIAVLSQDVPSVPFLPAIGAVVGRYRRRASRQRRGPAHRKKQSHRAPADHHGLFPVDRWQTRRVRALRG